MADIRKRVRKIKYNYADSVWNIMYMYYHYKNESGLDLSSKYSYMIMNLRMGIREYDEYLKWKAEAEMLKRKIKHINTWYNYLEGKNNERNNR